MLEITKRLEEIEQVLKAYDGGYVPCFSDFNHPFNHAVDTRYIQVAYGDIRDGGNAFIQILRLGPMALVRPDIKVDRFYRFWIGESSETAGIHPSLMALRNFLDGTDPGGDEVPDELINGLDFSAALEVGTYRHFVPYGGTASSRTPDEERLARAVLAHAPRFLGAFESTLEAAIASVKKSHARMLTSEEQHRACASRSYFESPEIRPAKSPIAPNQAHNPARFSDGG